MESLPRSKGSMIMFRRIQTSPRNKSERSCLRFNKVSKNILSQQKFPTSIRVQVWDSYLPKLCHGTMELVGRPRVFVAAARDQTGSYVRRTRRRRWDIPCQWLISMNWQNFSTHQTDQLWTTAILIYKDIDIKCKKLACPSIDSNFFMNPTLKS